MSAPTSQPASSGARWTRGIGTAEDAAILTRGKGVLRVVRAALKFQRKELAAMERRKTLTAHTEDRLASAREKVAAWGRIERSLRDSIRLADLLGKVGAAPPPWSDQLKSDLDPLDCAIELHLRAVMQVEAWLNTITVKETPPAPDDNLTHEPLGVRGQDQACLQVTGHARLPRMKREKKPLKARDAWLSAVGWAGLLLLIVPEIARGFSVGGAIMLLILGIGAWGALGILRAIDETLRGR